MAGSRVNATPVSYTHLDVYKRQLQQGTQKIFVGEYTGSTLQQFAFVPVADEIAPGFYHIAPADDDSQALGTSEDGSISLQASASAQIFVPVRAYSSYMLVDYESGNALYLDEDGSIHQEAIDSTDPAQLWQIKFELDENGDPTENILISCLLYTSKLPIHFFTF